MIFVIQKQQTEKLMATGKIYYQEIYEILQAFQIASGQSFAIGKTKALLEYVKKGRSFLIENFEYSQKSKKISSIKELANIYKDIDQHVDLTTDKDFRQYFS